MKTPLAPLTKILGPPLYIEGGGRKLVLLVIVLCGGLNLQDWRRRTNNMYALRANLQLGGEVEWAGVPLLGVT